MAGSQSPRRRVSEVGRRSGACVLLMAAAALLLGACAKENTYAAPPPAEVGVAQPLQQTVALHLEQTGNASAINTVDLVARVEGYLTDIKYQDGAQAKKSDTLFIIEQPPYQAQLQQAQASLIAGKAELVKSEAELERQSTLRSQDVSTQVALDKARAQRDSDKAAVMSQEAGVEIAKINLGYTTVSAPFDGIVTRHLVSVGELVGGSTKTKLATIVQLDPIYVSFNMSEQDLLKIRDNLGGRRLTLAELNQVPMEVGLMDEEGFPHKGHLDYVSPDVDPNTGTIQVRGVFNNPDRALLPGMFVRIRIPTGKIDQNALLVPDRALGQNQEGRYLLVLNKDDVVEQRKVKLGQQIGDLRIIESGIKADDRVIVTGLQRAIPGKKVKPAQTAIASAAPAAAGGSPSAPAAVSASAPASAPSAPAASSK